MNPFTIIQALSAGLDLFKKFAELNKNPEEITQDELAEIGSSALSKNKKINIKKPEQRPPIELATMHKSGVTPYTKTNYHMYSIIPILELSFARYNRPLVVTSTYDLSDNHMQGSLHYEKKAIDVRINHLKAGDAQNITHLLTLILRRISINYQIVLESDHIHVEYDDREPRTS